MATDCSEQTDLNKITLAEVVTLDQAQQKANEILRAMGESDLITYSRCRRFLEKCCQPITSLGKVRLWHIDVVKPMVAHTRRNRKD